MENANFERKIKLTRRVRVSLFSIAVGLTIALLMLFGLGHYRFLQNLKTSQEFAFRMEEIKSAEVLYHEALSSSAFLSAETGDERWVKRYQIYLARSDLAVQELCAELPVKLKNQCDRIEDTRRQLRSKEAEALEYLKTHDGESAKSVLTKSGYQALTQAYPEIINEAGSWSQPALRLQKLKGLILYYDEALTMSARLGVLTGNSMWEERYDYFNHSLEDAINEILLLAPEMSFAASQTEAANKRLIAMERNAFKLAREGQLTEAQAILFSDEYEIQKRLYATGMSVFGDLLKNRTDRQMKREISQTLASTVVLTALLFLWTIGFCALLRINSKWQKTILDQNRELQDKSDALTKLNETLDNKVLERTRELERSQHSAVKMMQETRKAHAELKSTQLQLIQAAKMESVGRLAAGVAHEVKNPLAIMQMGVDYLKMHSKDDEIVAKVLADMSHAVRRADSVIRGMLDFSASNKIDVQKTDVHALIEQSLALVKHELTRHRIAWKLDFEKGLPELSLDRPKIEQVLINIFMNAIYAMGEGGTLAIKTSRKAMDAADLEKMPMAKGFDRTEAVVIQIDDTGSGIPAEKLEKIFDPFFTTKPTGSGTGLGLSVTKRIIDLHGGVIHIANRIGGGVRVTLVFAI